MSEKLNFFLSIQESKKNFSSILVQFSKKKFGKNLFFRIDPNFFEFPRKIFAWLRYQKILDKDNIPKISEPSV